MQIDLSSIKTEKELHKLLAKELVFPEFYGKNWDAFWDSITGLVELPETIEFINSQSFKIKLPCSHEQLEKCFKDLAIEYPDIICSITWK